MDIWGEKRRGRGDDGTGDGAARNEEEGKRGIGKRKRNITTLISAGG